MIGLMFYLAGGNHDGALLTDSIIVASYNLKSKDVTFFSIPRDLWLDNAKQKVNAVYETGLEKGVSSSDPGLKYAEDKIDDVMGLPIHYGIVLDFSGFSKAINLVGGVDVNVPNTFDDYEYPIQGRENDLCGLQEKEVDLTPEEASSSGLQPGKQKVLINSSGKIATDSASFACRFEHIHFDKGLTHLDGVEALKFVRSRHAFGVEGSDFARSRRQQLVIEAFRDKVLSAETLANPGKLISLVDTFGKSLVTDIPKTQYLEFYGLTKSATHVTSVVLGNLGNGKSLFINPPLADYGGAWVLIPPKNDFQPVKDFVRDTLNAAQKTE
jgi:polyisoprenyl-teichoic acid--peptidoglycan teichoic acid transferase